VKESVADRVRRFKENSPRFLAQNRKIQELPQSEENLELTPLSSCGSVEDILAVLRARATDTIQQQTSTDLSEILHDIRTSCSEVSRISDVHVDERAKVKALLKRLSFDSASQSASIGKEDDPSAVLARIKERLKIESKDKKTFCVSDPIVLSPEPLYNELSSMQAMVQIPRTGGIDSELQTERFTQRNCSVVSVLVDEKAWINEASVAQAKPSLIKSLPVDRDWRRYVLSEVERTRASIYERIKAERSIIQS
jgi:hypothetical protein